MTDATGDARADWRIAVVVLLRLWALGMAFLYTLPGLAWAATYVATGAQDAMLALVPVVLTLALEVLLFVAAPLFARIIASAGGAAPLVTGTVLRSVGGVIVGALLLVQGLAGLADLLGQAVSALSLGVANHEARLTVGASWSEHGGAAIRLLGGVAILAWSRRAR